MGIRDTTVAHTLMGLPTMQTHLKIPNEEEKMEQDLAAESPENDFAHLQLASPKTVHLMLDLPLDLDPELQAPGESLVNHTAYIDLNVHPLLGVFIG